MPTVLDSTQSLIEEAGRPKRKRIIRGGKLVTKFSCPPGYKYEPGLKGGMGTCVLMSAGEKRMRKISSKKASRTKRKTMAGSGRMKMMKSRTKSLRIRKRFGARVGEY